MRKENQLFVLLGVVFQWCLYNVESWYVSNYQDFEGRQIKQVSY